ncbi:MAG: Rieske 2Fe-2S domain-containing protein [Rhodanobacter sp.]|jgi:nitrite reductase/ring-hydroxylating ferredoxin subunit|uniref:Rieske (2Fe-2S) protein n=2 Tax=unclassified Rhodanobacter TaxID=2621553 RepID=A0AB74USI5_9GAMM|nr:Rieske 2Fe-2S domain-containing protein [Rhodanobacter sp.]MBN8946752.1 Rieske 2Fe-2S domain-containing protein [Rhodanobacter sp.]ODT95503.1 MAG: ferredoxin [Rhodanobacter sp. SCN 67-45]OJW45923.1 MAG: ferredoxin [Rhodanobacter sp. 67-28]
MDTVNETGSSQAHAVCALEQVPDGGATAVDAMLADGEESLILLRRGEQVNGYLNICPHAGNRLDYAPGKFLLKNASLICAVHGAVFNQADGLCTGGPCRGQSLRAVPLRVVDGFICLDPAALP